MKFQLQLFCFSICMLSVSCGSENSRCGDIIDKQIVSAKFYFIMNAESNIFNTNNNDLNSYVPDNSVSGEVSESVYNSFSVGEEYCAE